MTQRIGTSLVSRRAIGILALAALVVWTFAGCGRETPSTRDLRIFHAAGLTPVLDAVRGDAERDLGIRLQAEGSGSQVACRKLSELGRDADLVGVADAALVEALLNGVCSWRIDFANDEVVLAVGSRARYAGDAEEDWVSVLSGRDVRIGRVDENQGPIGYRTLLVWKLAEARGADGLYDKLLAKADKVVDHVTRLTPLLKNGEIDYAFVYESICIARDIRFIPLDPAINLGSRDVDYSAAEVTYDKLKAGAPETVTVRGAPVTWALSIPDRGADADLARAFVRYLLTEKASVLEKNGFAPIAPPRFFGSASAFEPFKDFCRHAGELE